MIEFIVKFNLYCMNIRKYYIHTPDSETTMMRFNYRNIVDQNVEVHVQCHIYVHIHVPTTHTTHTHTHAHAHTHTQVHTYTCTHMYNTHTHVCTTHTQTYVYIIIMYVHIISCRHYYTSISAFWASSVQHTKYIIIHYSITQIHAYTIYSTTYTRHPSLYHLVPGHRTGTCGCSVPISVLCANSSTLYIQIKSNAHDKIHRKLQMSFGHNFKS